MKNKSQQPQVAKPELLAFAFSSSPCSSDGPEHPAANGEDPGSNPGTGTRLISPTCSANCSWGLASGKPKAGLLRSTAILDASPEESKFQNEVPQLPN